MPRITPQTEQTPAGTFARDILNRLLIDLSWASSQLEGKTALETQMILNHKQAIEYLVLDPAHAQVSPDCIIALHAFLSDGLMADPTAVDRLRNCLASSSKWRRKLMTPLSRLFF
jgi:hypothetical protein